MGVRMNCAAQCALRRENARTLSHIMSSTSLHLPALPDYQLPANSPAYSRAPVQDEQRLGLSPVAINQVRSNSPASSFTKESKTKSVVLEIFGQHGHEFPVFGRGDTIRGKIQLQKREGVASVEIKVCMPLYLYNVLNDNHLYFLLSSMGTYVSKRSAKRVMHWTRSSLSSSISGTKRTVRFVRRT